MSVFYDFFKDLNSPIDDNDGEPLENDLPDLKIEHDLNQEITSDEIKKIYQTTK